jgi:hypothetical protein
MDSALTRHSWIVIPVLALLLPAAIAAGQPLRAGTAGAVVCLLPGLALTHWLQVRELLLRLVLSVALSLSLAVLISTALMFLHQWTWQRTLGALVAITVAASAPRLVLAWTRRRTS